MDHAGFPARRGRMRHVQTGLSDTDPDVLRLQTELLRQATPARRVETALSLSAALIDIAYAQVFLDRSAAKNGIRMPAPVPGTSGASVCTPRTPTA